jgi:hypothetical protein
MLLLPGQILDIEKEIDLGQIEEVIVMAKDELQLIDYYYGKCTLYCRLILLVTVLPSV